MLENQMKHQMESHIEAKVMRDFICAGVLR